MKKYLLTIGLVYFTACCGNCSEAKDEINWYKPDFNTSWQWQLSGNINTSYNVELYDIDLFDTNQSTIDNLHNQGKKVICYFSAGSYENWRSDKDKFSSSVLGNNLDGWAGEKWLDITRLDILAPIMNSRLDFAKSKKCDGVEPDNVDGYTNDTGFSLSETDQLNYNKYLAFEAHKRGLSIALKNDLNQIIELEPYFDFAVNEQCHQYNECDKMNPFINANKPVFNAEYNQKYIDNNNSERDNMCSSSISNKLKTLIVPILLDDNFRISCD